MNGGVADTASIASNCVSVSDTGVPVQSLYKYVVAHMTAEHMYPCVFVHVCMCASMRTSMCVCVCDCTFLYLWRLFQRGA